MKPQVQITMFVIIHWTAVVHFFCVNVVTFERPPSAFSAVMTAYGNLENWPGNALAFITPVAAATKIPIYGGPEPPKYLYVLWMDHLLRAAEAGKHCMENNFKSLQQYET